MINTAQPAYSTGGGASPYMSDWIHIQFPIAQTTANDGGYVAHVYIGGRRAGHMPTELINAFKKQNIDISTVNFKNDDIIAIGYAKKFNKSTNSVEISDRFFELETKDRIRADPSYKTYNGYVETSFMHAIAEHLNVKGYYDFPKNKNFGVANIINNYSEAADVRIPKDISNLISMFYGDTHFDLPVSLYTAGYPKSATTFSGHQELIGHQHPSWSISSHNNNYLYTNNGPSPRHSLNVNVETPSNLFQSDTKDTGLTAGDTPIDSLSEFPNLTPINSLSLTNNSQTNKNMPNTKSLRIEADE